VVIRSEPVVVKPDVTAQGCGEKEGPAGDGHGGDEADCVCGDSDGPGAQEASAQHEQGDEGGDEAGAGWVELVGNTVSEGNGGAAGDSGEGEEYLGCQGMGYEYGRQCGGGGNGASDDQ